VRFAHTSDPASFVAFVDLGGQDLGEEHQMRLGFAGRDVGEVVGLGVDGG